MVDAYIPIVVQFLHRRFHDFPSESSSSQHDDLPRFRSPAASFKNGRFAIDGWKQIPVVSAD